MVMMMMMMMVMELFRIIAWPQGIDQQPCLYHVSPTGLARFEVILNKNNFC